MKFEPCLPTQVTKPPTGERWIHEIKHDGFRLIARKAVGGRIGLFTKQGHDWAERFPLIVRAFRSLRPTSVTLDGEVLCFSNGKEDFDKLWSNKHNETAQLCAFDLLELNGVDWRSRPLIKRKERLRRLLPSKTGISYVDHIEGDGAVIFEHACKLGLEGIVSKRVDATYQPGRSRHWLKVKNRAHPSIARVREAFERQHRAGLSSLYLQKWTPGHCPGIRGRRSQRGDIHRA